MLVDQELCNKRNCPESKTHLGPHPGLLEVPVSVTYTVVTAVASALRSS